MPVKAGRVVQCRTKGKSRRGYVQVSFCKRACSHARANRPTIRQSVLRGTYVHFGRAVCASHVVCWCVCAWLKLDWSIWSAVDHEWRGCGVPEDGVRPDAGAALQIVHASAAAVPEANRPQTADVQRQSKRCILGRKWSLYLIDRYSPISATTSKRSSCSFKLALCAMFTTFFNAFTLTF